MIKKIVFLMFFSFSLYSYGIFLINDSPFELTAIVQGANGMELGKETLKAGEQRQWSTDMKKTDIKEIYDADRSLTPFTVIWKCSYKGYYSICTNVSPGSTVSAQSCPGSKECTPKPKEDENAINLKDKSN